MSKSKTKQMKYFLSVQLNTNRIESVVFDQDGEVTGRAYNEIPEYYPEEGWIEASTSEIWRSTTNTITEALSKGGVYFDEIIAIGIANQKNTVVVWDKRTGEAVHNVIGSRCDRAQKICNDLEKKKLNNEIKKRTGLNLSPEHAGLKLKWIIDHEKGVKSRALKGELLFGDLGSWLLWKITDGKSHLTDMTNASYSMLFNIKTQVWDKYIIKKLGIPVEVLPCVKPSSYLYGQTERYGNFIEGIPVGALAASDQAALIGLGCVNRGMVRVDFSEGSSFIMNIAGSKKITKDNFNTIMSCSKDKNSLFTLQGAITSSGVNLEWLRDNLKMINSLNETDGISDRVDSTNGLYVVPAYEDSKRNIYGNKSFYGTIVGLGRNATKDHLVKATLESLAYQTRDMLDVISKSAGIKYKEITVDGNKSRNNSLMQFLADILAVKINVPSILENAAFGVVFLAGLSTKNFKKIEDIKKYVKKEKVFVPRMSPNERKKCLKGWEKALKFVISYN